MAKVPGGVEAVVLTGGIGENSTRVPRDAASSLAFAGIELAVDVNAATPRAIWTRKARVRVLVIRSRKDLGILREALRFRYQADDRIEVSL